MEDIMLASLFQGTVFNVFVGGVWLMLMIVYTCVDMSHMWTKLNGGILLSLLCWTFWVGMYKFSFSYIRFS